MKNIQTVPKTQATNKQIKQKEKHHVCSEWLKSTNPEELKPEHAYGAGCQLSVESNFRLLWF